MTNRERILTSLAASSSPLDDDELAGRCAIQLRQSVNIICRRLAQEDIVRRQIGPDGKLVNILLVRTGGSRGDSVAGRLGNKGRGELRSVVALPDVPVSDGSSREQRDAEPLMLEALGHRLGVSLLPRRITHSIGAWVDVDGADEELTVLVECWAHQARAKVAQQSKLIKDAVKLHWIAAAIDPAPRLVLCVSDEEAVRQLRRRSWQGQAIRALRVMIQVIGLAQQWVARITAAQKRQYR